MKIKLKGRFGCVKDDTPPFLTFNPKHSRFCKLSPLDFKFVMNILLMSYMFIFVENILKLISKESYGGVHENKLPYFSSVVDVDF